MKEIRLSDYQEVGIRSSGDQGFNFESYDSAQDKHRMPNVEVQESVLICVNQCLRIPC